MIDYEDQYEMKKLLEETNKLTKENNEILKKLHRDAKIGLWLRITWYVVIIGLPFALYFYVLEPYSPKLEGLCLVIVMVIYDKAV